MLAALLIVFREVLEAGLVAGLVLAATRGVPRRGLFVAVGALAGLAGALVAAVFANEIAMLFEGSGQELLNAAMLGLATLMLGWTAVWMSAHGREMAAEVKGVGRAVAEGSRPLTALAVVVGVAVLREGAEVVLFLYSLIVGGAASSGVVALGGALGFAGGLIVSALVYCGLVSLPKQVFGVMSALIVLLAAGLAAQAVGLVQSTGFWPELSDPLWDTSSLLSDSGFIGGALHTLVGYTAEPSGLQLAAYGLTVGLLAMAIRTVGRHVRMARQVAV